MITPASISRVERNTNCRASGWYIEYAAELIEGNLGIKMRWNQQECRSVGGIGKRVMLVSCFYLSMCFGELALVRYTYISNMVSFAGFYFDAVP